MGLVFKSRFSRPPLLPLLPMLPLTAHAAHAALLPVLPLTAHAVATTSSQLQFSLQFIIHS